MITEELQQKKVREVYVRVDKADRYGIKIEMGDITVLEAMNELNKTHIQAKKELNQHLDFRIVTVDEYVVDMNITDED